MTHDSITSQKNRCVTAPELRLPGGGVEEKVVQMTVTNAEHVRAGIQSCQGSREPSPNVSTAQARGHQVHAIHVVSKSC